MNNGERVIIILERSTLFPYFRGKVETYNVQEVIDKYRRNSTTLIGKVLNYRFTLYPQCKKFAKRIINREDAIVYTPSYNMYSVRPFLDSKYCKGYFYIEDGALSYLSAESLHKRYYKRKYKGGLFLMSLLGAGEKPDCYVNKKFMGCVGVSEYAYPWCMKNKVITSVTEFFSIQSYEDLGVKHVIISDYLRGDCSVILDAFNKVIDRIEREDHPKIIAIKFHPSAYTYELEKTKKLKNEIKKKYNNIEFIFLSSQYSIETMMYFTSVQLYSIFGASSLLLYALVLKSKAFMVNHKDKLITIRELPTVQDFVDYSNRQYEYR